MVTIVFTASPNWFSRLIRWCTSGRTSHVFLEFSSVDWGDRWVIEAGAYGVRVVPARMARHNIVAEFDCLFPTDDPIRWAVKYVGKPYDVWGLFVIGWSILLWRVFKRKLKKPLNNTKGQFCAEFVSRFLQRADVLPSTTDPELVYPDSLLNTCSLNSKYFKERKVVIS